MVAADVFATCVTAGERGVVLIVHMDGMVVVQGEPPSR